MPSALIDLILPARCAGCGAPGSIACAACTAELVRAPASRPPDPAPPGLPPCWSATVYDGAARRMLLAYKERGRTALAPVLGQSLAAVAAKALYGRPSRVILVPVPSARAASRARGHDPVRAIATAAAAVLRRRGMVVSVAPVLGLARRVADQSGLGSAERAANLSGAFTVAGDRLAGVLEAQGRSRDRSGGGPHGRLRGGSSGGFGGGSHGGSPGGFYGGFRGAGTAVALVDDIVTTGATLAEAARAFAAMGLPPRSAITIAATRRKRDTPGSSTLSS
ncbi:hypothetical protein Pth03_17130 [Planotetraspora thailandica]|uniref:Phosphoribosyltransferase n=1 Tax=Planotetraspora thailandica TaxID=487172 RepID=A0A8J3V3E5_9ACTN|nr:ComF family protein [Planotetraspora thailandica]GII53324.1 hypothetical protein Pth03_17130 [Planotetraspora thailandica]